MLRLTPIKELVDASNSPHLPDARSGARVLVAPGGPAAGGATPPAPTPQAAAACGARGGRGAAPVKSPEVGSDGRVTFRLRAPNANEVAVAMGGKRLPMQKDEQGVWSVTSDPMTPDIYTYSLVVDGASMNDPANRQVQTSFGSFQSMFVVPGPEPWLPSAGRSAGRRHPSRRITRRSPATIVISSSTRRLATIAHRAQPYPVLYLLHGLGDDAERWLTGGGGADNILDNLIAQKKAVPMVVVTPLGYGTSTGPPADARPTTSSAIRRSCSTKSCRPWTRLQRQQESRATRDCGSLDGRRRNALRRPESSR